MKNPACGSSQVSPLCLWGLALYSVCATIMLLCTAGEGKRDHPASAGSPLMNPRRPDVKAAQSSSSPFSIKAGSGAGDGSSAVIHWAQVETEDFAKYIRNLRRIGCPEKTIRRIVTAEIQDQFDERRNELLAEEDPIEFWRGEYGLQEENSAAFQALEEEEGREIAVLLGPPGEDLPPTLNGRPTGLRFGPLLSAKKGAILDITGKARSAMDAVLAGADGRELTLAEADLWRRAEQEREIAINRLLTLSEREEFDLRNSPAADAVRASLSKNGLDVSEADFRKLFRIRQNFETGLSQSPTGSDWAAQAEQIYRTAMAEVLGDAAVLQY